MKKIIVILASTTILSGCDVYMPYSTEREIKAYKSCLSAGMKAEAKYNGKIICVPSEQIRSLEDLKRHLNHNKLEEQE